MSHNDQCPNRFVGTIELGTSIMIKVRIGAKTVLTAKEETKGKYKNLAREKSNRGQEILPIRE